MASKRASAASTTAASAKAEESSGVLNTPSHVHLVAHWQEDPYSHHTFTWLMWRPVVSGVCLTLLGLCFLLISSAQALWRGYIAISGVSFLLYGLLYLLEGVSMAPIVHRVAPSSRTVPSARNPAVKFSVYAVPTNLRLAARLRLMYSRFFLAVLVPICIIIGAAGYKRDVVSNMFIGVTGIFILVCLLAPVVYALLYGLVRWCTRTRMNKDISDTFKIVQLNANCCVGTDGRFDCERVAGAIQAAGADVVALQEIERLVRFGPDGLPLPEARSSVDTLALVANLCNMTLIFGKSTSFYGGEYGNAILVRPEVDILRWEVLRFSSWKFRGSLQNDPPEPRCALCVQVRVKGSLPPVWVVSTQFGMDSNAVEQLHEMRELCAFLLHLPVTAPEENAREGSGGSLLANPTGDAMLLGRHDVVVCGDMASIASDPCMTFAAAYGLRDSTECTSCPGMMQGTYPAGGSKWSMAHRDRIMVPSACNLRILNSSVLSGSASSHSPLQATIGFAK